MTFFYVISFKTLQNMSISGYGYEPPMYGGYEQSSYGGYEPPTYGGYQAPMYGGYEQSSYGGYETPTYGGYPPYGGEIFFIFSLNDLRIEVIAVDFMYLSTFCFCIYFTKIERILQSDRNSTDIGHNV